MTCDTLPPMARDCWTLWARRRKPHWLIVSWSDCRSIMEDAAGEMFQYETLVLPPNELPLQPANRCHRRRQT